MSNLEIETDLWSKNINNICGIDEVGRGCLAGPVYSGAVVLDQNTNFESKEILETSKKSLKEFNNKSSKEILDLIKKKSDKELYSSRILNLGIYIIIRNSNDFKETEELKQNKIISNLLTNLNLSVSKGEKDIGIYKSSIKKLAQAKELIDELKVKNKNK